MLPAPEQPDQPVELQTEDGHYVFQLPELTAAGTYTAVAEYAEARPDLAAGLSNKDAKLRSASVRFEVHPCQPVTMRCVAERWSSPLLLHGHSDLSAWRRLGAPFACLTICTLQAGGGISAREGGCD